MEALSFSSPVQTAARVSRTTRTAPTVVDDLYAGAPGSGLRLGEELAPGHRSKPGLGLADHLVAALRCSRSRSASLTTSRVDGSGGWGTRTHPRAVGTKASRRISWS